MTLYVTHMPVPAEDIWNTSQHRSQPMWCFVLLTTVSSDDTLRSAHASSPFYFERQRWINSFILDFSSVCGMVEKSNVLMLLQAYWDLEFKVSSKSFEVFLISTFLINVTSRKAGIMIFLETRFYSCTNRVSEWVSEWLLFNANAAICQLYHGENKLLVMFNDMMMRSALY